MLKKVLFLTLFLPSLPALACYRIQGKVSVDGETFPFEQKVEHGKEYSLPMGHYIFNIHLRKFKESKDKHHLAYSLVERKKNQLMSVTKGEEDLQEEEKREIYAKGEKGQPHSIINIKITDI